MNDIKRKGVLLLAAILLLVAAGIYMTYGWYTKMTSVGGMEFNVARWDFSANYSLGDFQLNVYRYGQVDGGRGLKAAPGTAGEIPVVLSAELSDTDVNYNLTIDKSTMSPEFRQRIFFYRDKEMTQMITPDVTLTGTIEQGDSETVTIYWKWIYEFKDIPKGADGKTADKYDLIANETESSFDQFDTAVGKRPDLYEPQMNATVRISGLQTEPVKQEGSN